MTQAEFSEIIEQLQECLNGYKYSSFDNNKTTMYLANGDIFNIRFPKNGIAHLLGVNIDYLRQSNLFKNNASSFDCLEDFLDNSYQFAKLIFREKKLNIDKVFSPHIKEKIESFKENMRIKIDEIVAVVKYNSERTYQSDPVSDVSDYFIIRYKQHAYYVLGIIKNNNSSSYNPTTSRKYTEYKDYVEFLKRVATFQELTYADTLMISNPEKNFDKKILLSIEDKVKRVDYLNSEAKKYNANVTVGNTFYYYIQRYILQVATNTNNIQVIKLLKEAILSGNTLEIDNLEVHEEIKSLIKVCNNLVNATSEHSTSSFNELSKENEELKVKVAVLSGELEEKDKENRTISRKLREQENANELYQKQLDVYEEAHKKVLALKR